MELKYFEEARLNKCLIVSACGFDSIPSEMGVVMLQDRVRRTANKSTETTISLRT